MAKKDLQALVQHIEESIFKNSEDFRKLVSDFKVHEISLDVGDIIKQVEFEMYSRENPEGSDRKVDLTPATKQIIKDEVTKMVGKLYDHFNPKTYNQSAQKWTIASDLVGTRTSFTFVLAAKKGKTPNVFNTFKRQKQKAQRPLIRALNKKIRELNKGSKNFQRESITARGGGFLDIGHGQGSAVNTQRAQVTEEMIGAFSNKNTNSIVDQFLKELKEEISLSVQKSDKGPPIDVITVGLESKRLNRASTSAEKKEVGRLNKILEEAVEKFALQFPEMEGSDSSIQKRQKIVISNFIGPLKGIKNVKITGSDTTRKPSHSGKVKAKGKKAKPKKNKMLVKPKSKRVRKRTSSRKSAASQPLQLIVALNKELPQTVRNNMRAPALENRTGRFANSVKVTDVVTTPKGYPSIGYTYDRNPYEVFEMGSRGNWATPERDPRTLIDHSIREIASKFAMGRFYTRRV